MPTGPKGEKRPADVVGSAIMIARIATGETKDIPVSEKTGRVRSGMAGGKARAEKLSPKRRSEIARKAASERWKDE